MIEKFPELLLLYGIAAISIFIEQKTRRRNEGEEEEPRKDSKKAELCMCTYSSTSLFIGERSELISWLFWLFYSRLATFAIF